MNRLCFAVVLLCSSAWAVAGPRIEIVVGTDAPPLERLAADELVGTLRRAYEADVRIVNAPSNDVLQVLFVGSPKSNAAMEPFHSHWPAGDSKLSDQGHLLKTVVHRGQSALMIGGGSPIATYWAAAEFAHRIGERALLFGDLPPVAPAPLNLAGWDTQIEPQPRWREWRFAHATPVDSAAWGLAEYRDVLKQLAKLKFNYVTLSVVRIQPMPGISVGGDTSGRKAFGGVKLFENPDFHGATTDAARTTAGEKLLRGIEEAAKEVGMTLRLVHTKPREATVNLELNVAANVLPRIRNEQWRDKLSRLAQAPGSGLSVTGYFLGDLDFAAYRVSRVCSGENVSAAMPWHELLTPICGEEVDTRVVKAFEYIEIATKLIDANDTSLGELNRLPDGFAAPPPWWNDVRSNYLNAMNEMYRANTRARDGGRAFTLYFARRFEFAYEYMNCVEAIRMSRIAEEKKDVAAQVAELEKAIESLNAGLNAMAAVARSNSDRGLIAALNEYVYRPLKKRRADAEAAQR